MAWDFSTDPEFKEKLDWIRTFVSEEVEPLDVMFAGWSTSRWTTSGGRSSIRSSSAPASKGCGPPHLGPELGGQGFGAVRLTQGYCPQSATVTGSDQDRHQRESAT
jgi:acyl-CoA dehydrogenase